MRVLLATSGDLPQGEPGATVLDAELAGRGIDFSWARWDDDHVDWDAAGTCTNAVVHHATYLTY